MSPTHHAAIRAQQRSISPFVIDLLLRFGRREHDNRGAEIVFFDRRSKKKVVSYTGGVISKMSEHLDAYAVIADGAILTVGVRCKKINLN